MGNQFDPGRGHNRDIGTAATAPDCKSGIPHGGSSPPYPTKNNKNQMKKVLDFLFGYLPKNDSNNMLM